MPIFRGVLLCHHPPGNATLAFLERAFFLYHLHSTDNPVLEPRQPRNPRAARSWRRSLDFWRGTGLGLEQPAERPREPVDLAGEPQGIE